MKFIPTKMFLTAALAAGCGLAQAQDYPVKPIRIISGPGPDIVARLYGRKLTEAWGQQVLAESLPAGGGRVAAETVARATADGYVLLNATPSFIVATAMGMIPVNLADLAPVTLANHVPFALVTNAQVPASSVAELVSLARSRPGQLNYGSGGTGTLPHLIAEMFKQAAGLDIVQVPYKAADQAMPALIAGQTQLMFTSFGVALPQSRSGKTKVLAVAAPRRSPLAPDVPTLAESGVAGVELMGWNGFTAPAGTPAAILTRLATEMQRAARAADMAQQFANLGFEAPEPDYTPARFGEFVRAETAKWTKLVRETGIKVE